MIVRPRLSSSSMRAALSCMFFPSKNQQALKCTIVTYVRCICILSCCLLELLRMRPIRSLVPVPTIYLWSPRSRTIWRCCSSYRTPTLVLKIYEVALGEIKFGAVNKDNFSRPPLPIFMKAAGFMHIWGGEREGYINAAGGGFKQRFLCLAIST